jgi:hypothetical protein
LVVAGFDGSVALRHASALASLGPHPAGSPRSRAAAEYVAAGFRTAGLGEVRLTGFDVEGGQGTNVIGVLRAPGPEFVVLSAHHDTAPSAPGALDDGGGVGVLIEVARVLHQNQERPRTVVFASFDAEELGMQGSRAYVASLGPQARNIVAALAIELCGWKGGTACLHTLAYPNPRSPRDTTIAPAWLVRTILAGARGSGGDLRLGDPLLSWLYQPAVRSLRLRFGADDAPFLQAGIPAAFVSDSSFSAFYPSYHASTDMADKLDQASLARMGQVVLGAAGALARVAPGVPTEPNWFVAFGGVIGPWPLAWVAILCVCLVLYQARGTGAIGLLVRLVQAGLFAFLAFGQPVPTLWILALPVVLALAGRFWLTALGVLPALSLLALIGGGWARGIIRGTWLSPWEIALLVLALTLSLVPLRRQGKQSKSGAGPKKGKRRAGLA